MNAAFSTSETEAINRKIELSDENELGSTHFDPHTTEFANYYDVDRTVEEIVTGDFKRIALQFPDNLLRDSVPIYRILKAKVGPGRDLYVLADTSYGSCCVDEVAAQHVDADVMVHYGHACMSQTYRLPVIYVFGKKELDINDCAHLLSKVVTDIHASNKDTPQPIWVKHDVGYTHHADEILSRLHQAIEPLQIPVNYNSIPNKLMKTPESDPRRTEMGASKTINPLIQDCTILYIGGESLSLTNLLMTHSSCQVYSYNPCTKTTRLESAQTNKLLMRRYAAVQKARDADVFGILVGTLGVASYLPLISHIRKILAQARKKTYTISVGKLNPAKLANFMEIECFVLVACPENSVIEAKEFLRPIITPYELEVALQHEPTWTGQYVLDFGELLAVASKAENVNDSQVGSAQDVEDHDPDQPMFSLVTGTYRHAKRYDNKPSDSSPESSSAVILRNKDDTVAALNGSTGAQFLQARTYRGLNPNVGRDAPSALEQGRTGIARGYQDDHQA